MRQVNDVIIAGAGVIGLTAAWWLRARGLGVTLLDAGEPGREASWAGGGILWPLYPWRYPDSVRALAARGAELYPDLCRQLADATGIDPEWRRTGLVILDSAERDAAAAWADANGWRCEHLSPRALRTDLPEVPAGAGGVLLPEVAQVRNPRLCRALAEALRADSGARLLAHSPARGVAVTGDGRFAGFRTDAGVIAGGAGVLAAGAWNDGPASGLGLPEVHPVKGQMLLLAGAPGALPHILLRRGRYAIPRADGRVLVGSTVETVGYDREPTAAARAELLTAAAAMCPTLAELEVEAHWAGLRPATADGEPHVGAVANVPGLFASIGHFRNGLASAPAAAERIAALIEAHAARVAEPSPGRL